MNKVQLVRVLPGATPVNIGIESSFTGFVLKSDGTQTHCYIKDLDPTQLANELLVSIIANSLGLPTPEVYLGIADQADLPARKAPCLPTGERFVFASADLRQPNLMQRLKANSAGPQFDALIREVLSWTELGKLYGFDEWVANIDRNTGNLLVGGSGKFWLIDHGQCMTGPNWVGSALIPHGVYRNRLSEWATPSLSGNERVAKMNEVLSFVNKISRLDASESLKNSEIELFFSEEKVEAMIEFLKHRVKYVSKLTNEALGQPMLIP